jgi:hypothetical protein
MESACIGIKCSSILPYRSPKHFIVFCAAFLKRFHPLSISGVDYVAILVAVPPCFVLYLQARQRGEIAHRLVDAVVPRDTLHVFQAEQ